MEGGGGQFSPLAGPPACLKKRAQLNGPLIPATAPAGPGGHPDTKLRAKTKIAFFGVSLLWGSRKSISAFSAQKKNLSVAEALHRNVWLMFPDFTPLRQAQLKAVQPD